MKLIVPLMVGIALSLASWAGAQEITTPEETVSIETTTEAPPPPSDLCSNIEGVQDILPEAHVQFRTACGIPDRGFASFKTWREYHRKLTHQAKTNRCRYHGGAHFARYASEIAPWRYQESIDYWKGRHAYARSQSSRCLPTTVVGIIRYVFGAYGSQAVSVAWCESKFSPWAVNGQYVGIFQMGYSERQTYGWYVRGGNVWTQVRSAYNYFVASGRDWSPWECKP